MQLITFSHIFLHYKILIAGGGYTRFDLIFRRESLDTLKAATSTHSHKNRSLVAIISYFTKSSCIKYSPMTG